MMDKICYNCGRPMTEVEPHYWRCQHCDWDSNETETDADNDNRDYEPDPYYGDPHEPYSLDDDTWSTCPECGSGLVNEGAMSDGDGDLYDSLICPLCQEERGRANEKWFGLDGEAYDSIEEMMTYDALYMEDDEHGSGDE